MIKIVQKQDIEDILTGNIDEVKSVVYYTHLMAAEDGIHPQMRKEGDSIICKLYSEQIEKLVSGQLICLVELSKKDEDYHDKEYNSTYKKYLNIWIKGIEPSDETLRVGFENLTIGLQQAVEKANTAVQHEEIEHFISVEEVKELIPSLEGYATESWVEGKGYLTEHQSLSGLATEEYVGGIKTELENEIVNKISVGEVYSKYEVDVHLNEIRGEIPSLEGYATEQWVESKGYLTAHQDLSGYVEKSEITDLVSITYLENSLQPYATETWVETQISTKVDRYDVYSKEEIDIQMNTLRGEIPSLAGLATQEYVDNQIGNLDTILDRILA